MSVQGARRANAGSNDPKNRYPMVIGIVGPTAVGKTAVGLELVERLGGGAEIVSADSMQVYRKMDIGAAKPTAGERARAVFHAIDVADPDEDFTLADFQRLADAAYVEIAGKNRVALLVGGTGLYIRAVTTNLDIPQTPPDEVLRERWCRFAEAHGQEALLAELARVDPVAAGRIHVNDTKRIVRALEVYEKTGRPLSDWHEQNRRQGLETNTRQVLFALNRDRAALYEAIELRVDQMVGDGLFEEVENLRKEGYSPDLKPMKSLGYEQINAFLDDKLTREAAVDAIKRETRHFARRQLIWFRADKRLNWISTDGNEPAAIADNILHAVTALNGPFLST
ncbi:MAG TPA: tRNA (adenosine(37)-N6)-dimethylallyltransferase MiaA [Capsulimonadaceae bacterium]|nr:tRNA (adenosine(37)-N6)-dimethylallyltransferase MiaA [Capsulimonadaceae bacterium]